MRESDISVFRTVFANLLKRSSSCLANKGGHFEHLFSIQSFFFFFIKIYALFTLFQLVFPTPPPIKLF